MQGETASEAQRAAARPETRREQAARDYLEARRTFLAAARLCLQEGNYERLFPLLEAIKQARTALIEGGTSMTSR